MLLMHHLFLVCDPSTNTALAIAFGRADVGSVPIIDVGDLANS